MANIKKNPLAGKKGRGKNLPKKVCCECHEEKKLSEFYQASDRTNSIDGKVPLCKACYKNMSTNEDGTINMEGFKRALQIMDRPYIETCLQSAIEKCADPMSKQKDVLGDYMRQVSSLPQNAKTSFIQSIENGGNRQPQPIERVLMVDPAKNMPSEEDEIVYSDVWRGNYSRRDIEFLDQYYSDLQHDYKIVTSNHRDYARKIAKASLQMDKSFNDMIAGVAGADKRYKDAKDAFDQLCKSAKFSEATRSVNDVGISGFAKVAEMVEAHNWIPKHVVMEKDEIDKMLDYLSTITKSL